MENKIRFIPDIHIVDYPSGISHKVITEEDASRIAKFTSRMSEMMDEYKAHMVINEYIYIGVRKNGIPIDKSLRVKVDGPVYNKIKEMNGGEFPRYIHIEEAEKLDRDAIEPKI
jgi:hypothetical protein